MDRMRRIGEALGVAHDYGISRANSAAVATSTDLPRVRLRDDGTAHPADLAMLQDAEQEAVRLRAYRRAGFLHSAFEALRPKPRMTVEDCCPDSVDEQRAFFLQHGFIFLRNILPPDKLKRAQAAWTRAQARAEGQWQARKAAGALDASTSLYYDVPNLLSEDDCFIDMIDSPALVPLMSHITGSPQALDPSSSIKAAGYTGCMRVGGMAGRVIPSSINTHGPYSWHNDQPLPDDNHNPNYRSVKVFVGVFDLPKNGGATAVVPGTHRIPGGPSTIFVGGRGAFKSSGASGADAEQQPTSLAQNLMPNYVEAALPAGYGIAFDSHIWHTSMPNTSGMDRRCAYFVYRSSGRFWPQLPAWGPTAGLTEVSLRRLDSEGKLDIQRRRILGLPDTGTGE